MVSEYTKKLAAVYNRKLTSVTKLTPTLYDKTDYIIHYRNLKQCQNHGLKLVIINRGMKFKQSPWLKAYIEFNTEQWKKDSNTIEKDFFELLNNSVYGKTLENIRDYMFVKLINDEKKLLKAIAKPSFYSYKIFNSDLAGRFKIYTVQK